MCEDKMKRKTSYSEYQKQIPRAKGYAFKMEIVAKRLLLFEQI